MPCTRVRWELQMEPECKQSRHIAQMERKETAKKCCMDYLPALKSIYYNET
jgi:hypothetical protein